MSFTSPPNLPDLRISQDFRSIPSTQQSPKHIFTPYQDQKQKIVQNIKESLGPIHSPPPRRYSSGQHASKQGLDLPNNPLVREAAFEFTMKILRKKPRQTEERSRRIVDYYSRFVKRKFLAGHGSLQPALVMDLPNNINELRIREELVEPQKSEIPNEFKQDFYLNRLDLPIPLESTLRPPPPERKLPEDQRMGPSEISPRIPISTEENEPFTSTAVENIIQPSELIPSSLPKETTNLESSVPLVEAYETKPKSLVLIENGEINPEIKANLPEETFVQSAIMKLNDQNTMIPSDQAIISSEPIVLTNEYQNIVDRYLDSQPSQVNEITPPIEDSYLKSLPVESPTKLGKEQVYTPSMVPPQDFTSTRFNTEPSQETNQNLGMAFSSPLYDKNLIESTTSQIGTPSQKFSTISNNLTHPKSLFSPQKSKIRVVLRSPGSSHKEQDRLGSEYRIGPVSPAAGEKGSFITPEKTAKIEEPRHIRQIDKSFMMVDDQLPGKTKTIIEEIIQQQPMDYDLVIKIPSLSRLKDGIDVAAHDIEQFDKYSNCKYIAVLGLPGTGKSFVANYIATKKVYPYYYHPSNLITFKVVPNGVDMTSANIIIDSPGLNYPLREKNFIRKMFSNNDFEDIVLETLATSAFSFDYIKSLADVLVITTNKTTLMDQLLLSIFLKKFDRYDLIMVHNFPDVHNEEQLEKKVIAEIIDPFNAKRELMEPFGIPAYIQRIEPNNQKKIVHLVMVNAYSPIANLNEHAYNYINSEIGVSKVLGDNVGPINGFVEMINLRLKKYLVELDAEINSSFDAERHKIIFNMDSDKEFRVNPKFINLLQEALFSAD